MLEFKGFSSDDLGVVAAQVREALGNGWLDVSSDGLTGPVVPYGTRLDVARPDGGVTAGPSGLTLSFEGGVEHHINFPLGCAEISADEDGVALRYSRPSGSSVGPCLARFTLRHMTKVRLVSLASTEFPLVPETAGQLAVRILETTRGAFFMLLQACLDGRRLRVDAQNFQLHPDDPFFVSSFGGEDRFYVVGWTLDSRVLRVFMHRMNTGYVMCNDRTVRVSGVDEHDRLVGLTYAPFLGV